MKKDKNDLTSVFSRLWDDTLKVYRERPGNEIYATIFNLIQEIWENEKLKPLIVNYNKYPKKHYFIIDLPAKISYEEFKQYEEKFADKTKCTVFIDKKGGIIIMSVYTDKIEKEYPFEWNPSLYSKMYLPIPIGYSAKGLIVKDLSEIVNLLVAGHPKAGKSNFLHNLIVSLLLNNNCYVKVIDLKKGIEFAYLEKYNLVLKTPEEVFSGLNIISKYLDKRFDILKKAKEVKIQDYIKNGNYMPFVVLVIDELGEMQDNDSLKILNRLVRLGRAGGICVVCATQRPSSTMSKNWGDSKAMFPANLCYHVRDEINSRMVLDNEKACRIANIPGRAIFQWDEEIEVQTMKLPISLARKLLKEKGVKPKNDESRILLPTR